MRFALPLLLVLALAPTVVAQDTLATAESTGDDELSPQDEEARNLFQAGRVAFNDGRYDDAIRYFRQSHELSGRPVLLYNIGTAADRLRRNAEALEAFQGYLEAIPDAPNRREVESRIRVLREQLAREQEEDGEQTPAVDLSPGPVDEPEAGGLLTKWWFWTIVGAVVVGAVITTAVIASGGGPDYIAGDAGSVVFTLGGP